MTEYEFVGGRWDQPPPQAGKPESVSQSAAGASDTWELFRQHREVVTSLIVSSTRRKVGDASIWGAGFCQDINLSELLEQFNRVTLVDLELDALQSGLQRQDILADDRYIQLVETDLAGIDQLLEEYRRQPSPQRMQDLIQVAGQHRPAVELGHQSVIASTCMLSQLICKIDECVPDKNQEFVDLIATVRQRHIELIVENLKPGGTGLLITDFVSSESLPEIETTQDLLATVKQGVEQKNFLHGMNPYVIQSVFSQSDLQQQLESVQVSKPWRWPTTARIYVCLAFRFQKK